jgi:hypothetical protein
VFEDRSIDDIADDEIHTLVTTQAREQQRLEFKATWRISQDKQTADKEKTEMLMDISAMANAAGGYIIYGVLDDGNDRPGGYYNQTCEEAKKVKKTIEELSVLHISERIEGLEVRLRTIREHHLVIVKIPASNKAPHMVTYGGATIFQIRHDDSKRKMTIGEIRSAFNDDFFGRRLSRVEQELSQLLDYMKTARTLSVVADVNSEPSTNGNLLSEQRRKEIWEKHD